MSASYRDAPVKQIALRRFPLDREQNPVLPRIIERAPRPGDIHPLTRPHLQALLSYQPIAYIYGLKRIELRPRLAAVGDPYGCYYGWEKTIILYSTPPEDWVFPPTGNERRRKIYEYYEAEVSEESDGLHVRWNKPVDLAYFMYEVFLHEMGHHFDWQYRQKRKYPRGHRYSELSAERHAGLLVKRDVFGAWHQVEERKQGSQDAIVSAI